MTCSICNKDQSGTPHELNISGKKYQFFICDQCETEKGKAYEKFFDNIRENVKPEQSE